MSKDDNLVFIHEFSSARIAAMADRKYGKKLSPRIDEESLVNFFQAVRRVLCFYNVVEFTVVGIEFIFFKEQGAIKAFLVCNDRSQIEIKNQYIQAAALQLFPGKFLKLGKLFIHWNEVMKFEEEQNAKKTENPKAK